MAVTTPNMGLTVPVAGDTTPGYVDSITSSFNAVDAHDHSTGKGAKVAASNLSWATPVDAAAQAVTNLKTTRFADQVSLPAGANPRALYTVAGDLWYNNGTSGAIKLTSGAGFNASIVGGIAGTYASSGAQLVYATGSPGTYTFQNPSAQNANIVAAGLQLTAAPLAVTIPTTTKTFRVHPNRGYWPTPNGASPQFPTAPQRPTFISGSPANWCVPLPTPEYGNMVSVRVIFYANGSAITGSCQLITLSRTALGAAVSAVQNWPTTSAGTFTMTFPITTACAGSYFTMSMSSGGTATSVTLLSVEMDVAVAQLPDTLV